MWAAMKHIDMRSLAPAAQEERRRQVIGLRESGLTHEAIARQVGLTRNGVSDICKRYRARGLRGLRSGPRGPAVGTGRLLTRTQERQIRRLICRKTPDAYGLPYALWSRAAVAALVEQRCGVRLAVRSMGTYLRRWGFTPQKPLRRAYEQNPREVRRWVLKDYPAIAAKARRAKGKVHWLDESAVRSNDVRGRSFAPCGKTPEVQPSQKRTSVAVISAVTNQGDLRWMVLNSALTAVVLIMFLQRLIRDAGCKVFLIMDNLRVHRARAVQAWLAQHKSQIEVFYLPAYSPELNPDEGINGNLKQGVTSLPPARSRPELKRNVINHMRGLSRSRRRVRRLFQHRTFRYAA
jgi:transposase